MKRRQQPVEHDNQERWLLTYADLITLLLGLFVILYAMSKIDAGKYTEMVSGLRGVFGAPTGVIGGEPAVFTNPETALHAQRQRIAEEVRQALGPHAAQLPVTVSENERGVTVHIMEEMLFASGSAEIKQASLPTLDSLASVLRRLPNDVRVEGHTDNVPINTPAFPSNWHLSVARALNVAYYLITRHSLRQDRVGVVGYSEFQPLVPNSTPENRARNRRVDLVIVTNGGSAGTSGQQQPEHLAAAPVSDRRTP